MRFLTYIFVENITKNTQAFVYWGKTDSRPACPWGNMKPDGPDYVVTADDASNNDKDFSVINWLCCCIGYKNTHLSKVQVWEMMDVIKC